MGDGLEDLFSKENGMNQRRGTHCYDFPVQQHSFIEDLDKFLIFMSHLYLIHKRVMKFKGYRHPKYLIFFTWLFSN